MAKLILLSEELAALPEGAVIWQEYRRPTRWAIRKTEYGKLPIPSMFEPSIIEPFVMYKGMLGNYRHYLYPDEYDSCDSIRMHHRYWDKKPTRKQMDATPWPTWEECQKYWK